LSIPEFWRSSHFTYEATFYAQINPTPAFKEKLLRRTGASTTTTARQYYANEQPPRWYVPKSMDHYECYSTGDEFTPLHIFVDKDDGTMFIFYSQL
jgi:hypothetical protein